jgi:hypothetical protein
MAEATNCKEGSSDSKSALHIAVKKFIDTVDHKDGMGMKLTKTHSLLHVPDDVLMFGSGKNWDSGPSESIHKENVKRKAKLTSQCKDSLEDQVATHFEESVVIEHAKGILMPSNNNEVNTNFHSPSTGTRIKLTISWSGDGIPRYDSVHAAWDGRKGTKFGIDSTIHLPQHLALLHLLEIVRRAHDSMPTREPPAPSGSPAALFIRCFTDHHVYKTIPEDSGSSTCQIFRAHPAYHGGLPWNDWVYVQYCISTHQG